MAQRALAADAPARAAHFAARLANSDSDLGKRLREQRDLAREIELGDQRLISALSRRDKSGADILRKQRVLLDGRLNSLTTRLAQDFPDYVALVAPDPLSIASTQALLKPNEALVQFIDAPDTESTADEFSRRLRLGDHQGQRPLDRIVAGDQEVLRQSLAFALWS